MGWLSKGGVVPQLRRGAKSVLLRDGFLVCMAKCSVRSSGEAVLVCAKIVVLDDPMMCPDVLEW